MTTVSIAKSDRLTALIRKDFDDVAKAATFVREWLNVARVTIVQDDKEIHPGELFLQAAPKETKDSSNSESVYVALGEICPFCGEDESLLLADDEYLHGCESCDRYWYVDKNDRVLPADRCPTCESSDVSVEDDGARTCGACGHRFFFDGLTFIDPNSMESDGDAC